MEPSFLPNGSAGPGARSGVAALPFGSLHRPYPPGTSSAGVPALTNLMADASLLVSHLEVPEQVRSVIAEGPGPTAESLETYLCAIDKLRDSVAFIERVLRTGQDLLGSAMDTLEKRFRGLLASSSISPDPEELKAAMLSDSAPDHIRPPEVVAGNAVAQLHAISRRMVESDQGATLSRHYRECRTAELQRNFDAMQVLRLNPKDVQVMAWAELEKNMQKWNEHMHIGMIFIAAEREACDLVLDDLEPFREQCFVDLSRPCMMLLIGFGQAVAQSRQSPEKLFALLDMYETALDLHGTVEELFAGREGESVRREYEQLLLSLGQAAKETFEKFEDAVREQPTVDEVEDPMVAMSPSVRRGLYGNGGGFKLSTGRAGRSFFNKILKKSSKTKDEDAMTDVGSVASTAAGAACASGKVHPLASYVINYVIILCNGDLPYFANLEHAVGEAMGGTAVGPNRAARVQSKIAFAMRKILEALMEKLKARAEAMQDDVLAELFLMNNLSYILSKIEMSDAGRLLGVAWCGECAMLVDQHRDKYIANAISKFDAVFQDGSMDTAGLVRRVRIFNLTFEKLRQRQLSWSIQSLELRHYVRSEVPRQLVDRYRGFLTRWSSIIEQHKTLDVEMMTCADVEQKLLSSFPSPPPSRHMAESIVGSSV